MPGPRDSGMSENIKVRTDLRLIAGLSDELLERKLKLIDPVSYSG